MKALTRLVPAALVPGAVVALAVTAFGAPAAFAATKPAPAAVTHGSQAGARSAVFVMTDNTAGNSVAAYHRASSGALALAGTYSTGGVGGVLTGSVVDHTASQGALTYDRADGLLFAVNAGSDTVSVFKVSGDQLKLHQVISSGGDFPVSVTVNGNHVYVLDALGGGTLAGYWIGGGWVSSIPGSSRSLGLGTTAASQFTATPGEVAFTPDGHALLVTTKASTNAVDVFAVRPDGSLSANPTVNTEAGAVPFAVNFDQAGHVLVAEAGPSALATFTLASGGVLTQLAVADTGQMATCWITSDGKYFYTSNAGSGSVSGYTVGWSGGLTALGNTTTDAGTVDATSAGDGRFLYVQTGKSGIVDEFAVGAGGALTPVGSVTVAGAAGGEGIAAGRG
jgi:6-phosphogluconolactonase (cycloisomerase 2 family)